MLVVLLAGCSGSRPDPPTFYVEQPLEFQELGQELGCGSALSSSWLRSPENILRVHETAKDVGYDKLLDHFGHERPWTPYVEVVINRSLKQVLDELRVDANADTRSEYARQFWARREAEGNAQAVSTVVRELHAIVHLGTQPPIDSSKVIAPLRTLLSMALVDGRSEASTMAVATDLRELGLHASAHLVASGQVQQFRGLSKTSLLEFEKTLSTQATPPKCTWFEDDTK